MSYILTHLGKILDKLADVLLPKDSKVKLLEELGPIGLAEKIPRTENFDFDRRSFGAKEVFETESLKAIFNYKNELCRQAIWEIKYRANKKLIQDFSLLLYEFILEEISDLQTFNNFKNIIIIPVPSSRARVREKGFNQCVLICRELIKIDQARNSKSTFTLLENFLVKKSNTARQSKTKNRQERLENLKNTFIVNKDLLKNPENFSFILIDDVITTSATMQESFRALKSAGARKILGVALAH